MASSLNHFLYPGFLVFLSSWLNSSLFDICDDGDGVYTLQSPSFYPILLSSTSQLGLKWRFWTVDRIFSFLHKGQSCNPHVLCLDESMLVKEWKPLGKHHWAHQKHYSSGVLSQSRWTHAVRNTWQQLGIKLLCEIPRGSKVNGHRRMTASKIDLSRGLDITTLHEAAMWIRVFFCLSDNSVEIKSIPSSRKWISRKHNQHFIHSTQTHMGIWVGLCFKHAPCVESLNSTIQRAS